jgi:hypothetical protein
MITRRTSSGKKTTAWLYSQGGYGIVAMCLEDLNNLQSCVEVLGEKVS